MTLVENQGQTNSWHITANAIAADDNVDISRLFIYYNARVKSKPPDGIIKDNSSVIAHTIEELKESGICLESIWPYDIKQKIIDALRLKLDLNEMKGYPFVFGLKTFGFQHKGEKRYCYISYDYMTNPTLCFQLFAIHQVEIDDIGHENWDNNDSIDLHPDNADQEEDDDDYEIIEEEEVEEPEQEQ
ncbi:unnamed protein product [Rotaria sp. Silwood2]|nr:unnamed protein product [Rotaria sp. Silwood2]